jgi:cell division septation protein DedD
LQPSKSLPSKFLSAVLGVNNAHGTNALAEKASAPAVTDNPLAKLKAKANKTVPAATDDENEAEDTEPSQSSDCEKEEQSAESQSEPEEEGSVDISREVCV